MTSSSPIVSVTDFVRNFSDYMSLLPKINEIILTRDSRDVAILKATPREKNAGLKKFFGIWKGTALDNDKLWKEVLARRNRQKRYLW